MNKGLYFCYFSIQILFFIGQHTQSFANTPFINKEEALELKIRSDIEEINTIIPYYEKDKAIAISKPFFSVYPQYTEHLLGRAMLYFPFIESALKKYNLPEDLKYIPFFESGFRVDVVSSAGAVGMWQFMSGTGKTNGLLINSSIDERKDFIKSSEAAAKYLKSLYDEFQNWSLVLMAYNGGPYRLKKILRDNEIEDVEAIIRKMPRESQEYLSKMVAAKLIFQTYQSYELIPEMPSAKELYTKHHIVSSHFNLNNIAKEYNISKYDILALNPHIKRNAITLNENSTISIRIPIHDQDKPDSALFRNIKYHFDNIEELKKVAGIMGINHRLMMLINGYYNNQEHFSGVLNFYVPNEDYLKIRKVIDPMPAPYIFKNLNPISYKWKRTNSFLAMNNIDEINIKTKIYYLKPRETMLDVAQKFDLTLEDLLRLNPFLNLKKHQKIIVPTSKEHIASSNESKIVG